MKQRGFRYCSTCGAKLQKRGLTAAGTQRWYCPACRASVIRPRPDLVRAYELGRFVGWLLGRLPQAELSAHARTWRSRTHWCWQVVPQPVLTGETYDVVILDAIHLAGRTCLIARTVPYVVAWQWTDNETTEDWMLLLVRLPAPGYVVCDGQHGMLRALARCWPRARIQRCIFHVWMHVDEQLRGRNRSEAAKALHGLVRRLKVVRSPHERNMWLAQLEEWETGHGAVLQARESIPRSSRTRHQRSWRYGNPRLRAGYRHLKKVLGLGQLFTWMDEPDKNVPRTTNHVEGGINSQLRTKLKLHRGMPPVHQQRLVEWYLYSRTEGAKPPRNCL